MFNLLSSHAMHCENLQPKVFIRPLFLPRKRQLAGIMSAVLMVLPDQQVIFLIMIHLTILGLTVFIAILKGVQAKYKYSLFYVLVCDLNIQRFHLTTMTCILNILVLYQHE